MAQLFGKGTIKSHIDVLPGFDESKISIIKKLYENWKNGLADGETAYEQTFNQLFFGELLGYEDMVNRIPKGAVIGTGIADLTLGYFAEGKYIPEDIQVVCELKGAKFNLVKKQFGHGGLSPVGQGFSYKIGLKNCKRLIVSNFYEIRLYRDNQTDFEVWNLDELMDSKDNYFSLRKLYLLLHKDNLLAHTEASKTEKLLSHFREEQKNITKEFYERYKKLRVELINDIRHNNKDIETNLIIEKAQKIIDRLIFIFFCEDKGLLPDKKLKENIKKIKEVGLHAWDAIKAFFENINTGNDQMGIPQFDGGLFEKDDEINNLKISDTICQKFSDLTGYDFDDKLTVNVLGHIFEQSITDLEKLRVELLGEVFIIDTLTEKGGSKGRRKKEGIFYTPEYIIDYIVQNSVINWLNEKENECLNNHKNKKDGEKLAYQEYQHILQNIKVLDPACGSGAFLVRVFDILLEENKRVGSILNSLFDETETYKNILTNNIYGVDLNEESVEITKLSLWLKSAQKGKKLNNLDENIKCGNSLIDDPLVAREKAFDWNIKFKEIIKSGGFDIIVGNPPYGAKFSKSDFDYFNRTFKTSEYKIDTYVLFMEKGYDLLKKGGMLGFIVPYTFTSGKFFTKIRDFIKKNMKIERIVLLGKGIFDEADVDTLIFLAGKQKNDGIFDFLNLKNIENDSKQNVISQGDLEVGKIDIEGNKEIILGGEEISGLLSKINENVKLENLVDFYHGLQTKGDEKSISKEKLGDNCFVIIKGEDFCRYALSPQIKYINFIKQNIKSGGDIAKYTVPEKLIMRTTGDCFITTYDSNGYVCLNSVNLILPKDVSFSLKYLLCLLNSTLLKLWYHAVVGEEGKTFAEVKISYLKSIPIKKIPLEEQKPFIERADKMLMLNDVMDKIIDKFLHRVRDNLKVKKITRKLASFYKGDFSDFIDELSKQKISFALTKQDEWEPYFKECKEKILAVKGEIEKTDQEIDEMVYKLYGLTAEEVKVVEGK